MNHNIQPVELNIQIGQLVLDGISLTHEQRHQLKRTIETQLSELFSAKGIPKVDAFMPSEMTASAIQLSQQPAPVQLGKQIASSIYNGLSNNIDRNAGKTFNS